MATWVATVTRRAIATCSLVRLSKLAQPHWPTHQAAQIPPPRNTQRTLVQNLTSESEQCEYRTMAEDVRTLGVPTPEKTLRELARNVSKVLPNFADRELAAGVK